MTHALRRGAAVLAALLTLAACGGDGGTTADPTVAATEATEAAGTAAPTKDEFIDQVMAECETVDKAIADAEPEGDPFSPEATDEDRQAGVDYLRIVGEGLSGFSSNLRDFGLPEEDREGAEAIVDRADEASTAFSEAATAAEEDFAASQPQVGQAFGTMGQLESAAQDFGIGSLEECQKEPEPKATVAEGANEVPVTPVGENGESYDFEFEQPVPAGQTAFVMDNTDDEAHFMFVVKVTGKKSLDEIIEAEQQGEDPEAHAEEVGGSDDAAPGEQVVLNVENLEPGTYGMLCYIPGPEGEPHAYNGMAVEFEVE